MKKILLPLLLVLLTTLGGWAQIQKHDSWSYKVSKKEVKVGETVDLIFNVLIDPNWYMYSSDFSPEVGPTVTTFEFTKDPSYQLVGGVKAIKPKVKYDSIFEGTVKYFVGTATFRQTIKVLQPKLNVKGSVNFQVCSEVNGQCIPGDADFSFDNVLLKVTKAEKIKEAGKTDKKNDKEEAGNKKDEEIKEDRDKEKKDDEEKKDSIETTAVKNKDTLTTDNKKSAITKQKKDSKSPDKSSNTSITSLLTLFIFAFGGGLVALVTPCVFPMIPMTVTFFTKQSKTKKEGRVKALIYGLSIVSIFTIIGSGLTIIFGISFANWLSTHWVPNLIFFAVFFIFALSFLGMFEIVLPSSWVNKMDRRADKGGYAGIFFMAFTLVLVSFSCTGPIFGSAMLELTRGGTVVKPIVAMLGFSIAMALPFTLFAFFPSWLNSLPKSGGWLNNVKVVLGFVELGLALKFLSVIDQVYHLELLNRDVYLAFWIVIASMIGFYLLGKIRMPHDSPVEKISVPKAVLAVATFSFVVYMIPGMFGAPLDGLAGFLPPQNTQKFDMHRVNRKLEKNERKLEKLVEAIQNGQVQLAKNAGVKRGKVDFSKVKHSDKLHLPHDLKGFFDYKEALAYAKKVNKPIFIDFTGHGCVNCRKMEQSVWAAAPVLKRLEEDYVVVALYVDDKTTLPESEWYTSTYDNKVKKTIGAQNFDFQVSKFNGNAQPYYCLLDPATETLLVKNTPGYDPDADKFVKFLDAGLTAFKAKNKKDDKAMARK
ncbi:protein-disulfide reductase DsbD family protein [Microscilla marina]|uniref:Thiol:disulfide interchange protein DsbD n=1 Tax=Microscilla marina ATCC 23134 TaxID=313606 RepID=A1ZWJ0_MICM2|nr:protein-disulfide reductase DsbD [Microscilla marina]EAY25230.1 thiol:disulfide interchange protein DsbD [Microscilla marina ATCC 23134]